MDRGNAFRLKSGKDHAECRFRRQSVFGGCGEYGILRRERGHNGGVRADHQYLSRA